MLPFLNLFLAATRRKGITIKIRKVDVYMEAKWSKVIVHASAFFAPFLVPIIFFLISSEEEVKRISMQAILFQVVVGTLVSVMAFLWWTVIAIPFLIVFGVIYLIAPIIGIVKALGDTSWNYPIVGRWV